MANRDKADLPDNYTEPAPDLSAERFFGELLRHVRSL